jgi:hypothetical protein
MKLFPAVGRAVRALGAKGAHGAPYVAVRHFYWNQVVPRTLAYNDERGAHPLGHQWEREIAGAQASPAGASKACTPHFNFPGAAAS